MRRYATIAPRFWIGATGRKLRKEGPDALLVALYLITCQHSNMIGLYYLPLAFIAHETGLGTEGTSEGLRRATEAGFCDYDEDAEVVFVYNMARFQIGDELHPQDNRRQFVQRQYDELPDNRFLADFFRRYATPFHMTRGRGNASAFEGPSEINQSQEQKHEHEQGHEHNHEHEREQTRKRDQDSQALVPHAESTTVAQLLLKNKEHYIITQDDLDHWQNSYPSIDVLQQVRNMSAWLVANPEKQKTEKGILRFVTNWLIAEQNNAAHKNEQNGRRSAKARGDLHGKKNDQAYRQGADAVISSE